MTLNWLARRRWHLLIGLLLVVLVAGVGGRHLWAWHQLRLGRAALEQYHFEEARDHLNACLHIWPNSMEPHLLAARAAWRERKFDEAIDHLRERQRLERTPSEETILELSLARAAAGDPDEVEGYLRSRAGRDPTLAPLVWEALADGWTILYRIVDAMAILDNWLSQEPDNVQAHFLRGEVRRLVGAAEGADDDYRRALQLDPKRDDARRWLVRGLLRTGHYAEAQAHAEELLRRKRTDPELRVDLARALSEQGKRKEAREVLESVLAESPDYGTALREHGRLALREANPAEAEDWLRKAIRVLPQDYSANWDLAEAFRQQGKLPEADEQRLRARQIEDRRERLAEISQRQMSKHPRDPALHCELGALLIALDKKESGERWLWSALHLDPNFRPAHLALADLYEAQGEADKAAEQRKQAETAGPTEKP
jgi:tetratricopeptide (TPR) repeat protein